ncbi:hypothetical protein GCM10007928_10770 [Sulfitobacter porphyrae]|nr:hypothetical protein GCM10007928_10770 [Sulfitobacter porphyrae]
MKNQDIGTGGDQHVDHGDDLRIVTLQDVPQQEARALARKFGVVGGNPDALGRCCRDAADQAQEKGNQAVWNGVSASA